MSWVDTEVARIKREDENQENQRKWAIHRAEVLMQKAVEVWAAIVEYVKKDLAKLNASFESDERRQIEFQEIPAFGFVLKKKSGLSLQSVARMATNGRAITMTILEVRSPLQAAVETTESISIELDERENLFFRVSSDVMSIDGVSRKIFQPFIGNFSKTA
jgi:hypothetical protein